MEQLQMLKAIAKTLIQLPLLEVPTFLSSMYEVCLRVCAATPEPSTQIWLETAIPSGRDVELDWMFYEVG